MFRNGTCATGAWGPFLYGFKYQHESRLKESLSNLRNIFTNPRSGCQHKAWGGAPRNPRDDDVLETEPTKWAAAAL
jgi:hypothetical protein